MKKQTFLLTYSFAHTCPCPPITLFQFLESLEQKQTSHRDVVVVPVGLSSQTGLLLVPRGNHAGGEVSSPL